MAKADGYSSIAYAYAWAVGVQLNELVASSRDAGTPAELQVIGDAQPVSPLIGLTVYRVAQESLTNVRKHAGRGASAEVRLRYTADAVEREYCWCRWQCNKHKR